MVSSDHEQRCDQHGHGYPVQDKELPLLLLECVPCGPLANLGTETAISEVRLPAARAVAVLRDLLAHDRPIGTTC